VQTARALSIRAEIDGDIAAKRTWLERAAGYLRPAAKAGKLTRYEREVLLATIEKQLRARAQRCKQRDRLLRDLQPRNVLPSTIPMRFISPFPSSVFSQPLRLCARLRTAVALLLAASGCRESMFSIPAFSTTPWENS
jgi:hypothetical protein